MIEHDFTPTIRRILSDNYGDAADEVLERSPLLQYLNIKTRSASRGSKSRSSFANLYAIYVLVEDYRSHGFETTGYGKYAGANFSDLFRRQRELPFGEKLQNHGLNHRLNEEFHRLFPAVEYLPIIREMATSRYFFNENLLKVDTSQGTVNISLPVVQVIDGYVAAKRDAFDAFIEECQRLVGLGERGADEAVRFINDLLRPNVDARIFEIVSFAILKAAYGSQSVFFGWSLDDLQEESLVLYKTGRANANDGGIDFVMRPLGRFFQVTETTDFRKYFLDIDKVQRFPITFVVKSQTSIDELVAEIRRGAEAAYAAEVVVEQYMAAVEEVVNLPVLEQRLAEVVAAGDLPLVIEEIELQSRVEFNYAAPGDEDPVGDTEELEDVPAAPFAELGGQGA